MFCKNVYDRKTFKKRHLITLNKKHLVSATMAIKTLKNANIILPWIPNIKPQIKKKKKIQKFR